MFVGQSADRFPQFGKKRLARSTFQWCRRNALQREDLRADDAKCEAHVSETPLHEGLVVVHHRLDETEEIVLIARIALELDERHRPFAQQRLKMRPEALTCIQ